MASQRVSPTVICFVPALGLSDKEFKFICTEQLAQPVHNEDHYGVFSYRLGVKIYPTVLNYPQGGDQTIPGCVHGFIVDHAVHMKLDKAVYFVPASSATTMVDSFETLAKQLADSLGRTIYVHRGSNGNFRIGELKDPEDYQNAASLVHVTEAYPHPDLIRAGLYFGDDKDADESGDVSGHMGSNAAIPSTVDAYVHLKQNAEESKPRGKNRRAKKNEIPKPQNAWVLFLNANYKIVKAEKPHLRTTEISKIIAGKWKAARGGAVENYYKYLAEEAKKEHRALYGDYKVKPRKSSEIKRRNVKKNKTVISLQADLSPGMDGVGIDASEFQKENFDNPFASEGSGTFATHEDFAAVNQIGQCDTLLNTTNVDPAEDTAFNMNNQATSVFNGGHSHYNTQGSFHYSGSAAGMSTYYNTDACGIMAGCDNDPVSATYDGYYDSADDIAEPLLFDDCISNNVDLPGDFQDCEFLQRFTSRQIYD